MAGNTVGALHQENGDYDATYLDDRDTGRAVEPPACGFESGRGQPSPRDSSRLRWQGANGTPDAQKAIYHSRFGQGASDERCSQRSRRDRAVTRFVGRGDHKGFRWGRKCGADTLKAATAIACLVSGSLEVQAAGSTMYGWAHWLKLIDTDKHRIPVDSTALIKLSATGCPRTPVAIGGQPESRQRFPSGPPPSLRN
jgi:hypothetical protein